MTKVYWQSLINPAYPTDADVGLTSGSNLRSALERKANQGGGGRGGRKGMKKMKRGQAKTLSDLPKLNQ